MVSRHKSGGKAIKAIRARLKGKEGRLRGNLMGKRVDFSARTVITPDPTLDLDQLGVPRSIAENITVPEVVTPQNIELMRKLVNNGPNVHPGARYIKGEGGKMIDLNYARTTETFIDYGYVIERHLKNDDYVCFNRQPSLHKMSIMGHRVKVLPFSTFRLNLSVTGPYNADFDGDEMNMFVPQSLETKAEVKEIMHVPRQIISPQSNKPVMGIVQDTLAGIMMFTYRDTFIEFDMVMNLLMWIEDFDGRIPAPAIFKPRPLWTGKQILSLILPNINLVKDRADVMKGTDEWNNPKDDRILIRKGELISGIICKKTVGTSQGGIIHVSYNERGMMSSANFLSRAQRLVNNWLVNHSHTVGVADTIADSSVLQKIATTLQKAKEKVKVKLLKAQDGRLKCQPGKDMLETFEAKVNKTLNDARNAAGKLARGSLDAHNKIILMVLAGSKGNDNNISQIMACVGQQNVEGKRIPFGFSRRTLPHFGRDDYGPESRGFVENSYLRGLTPQEFYFHAMGGREGLIDTAVKTSETGYIQRRLVKALEDVMVKYDGTVRNSMEHIIQFIYGEDGIAGEKLEGTKLRLLDIDNRKLEDHCRFNPIDDEDTKSDARLKMIEENANDVLKNPEVHISLQNEFNAIKEDRVRLRNDILEHGEDTIYLPVNINRLILKSKQEFGLKTSNRLGEGNKSDLHPYEVIEDLKKLTDSLKVISDRDKISHDANDNAVTLFRIALRFHLCSKKMILQEKMSKQSFSWLCGEIKNKFDKSLVHPGEMVGSIAAQSMGEPATQMTLNTFHSAGISSKNVTLGVPRLKEIINVAKNIKTPSLAIYLQDGYSKDQNIMREVQSSIEHTTLEHVMLKSEIYYDPNPEETIINDDEDIIELYKVCPTMENTIALKDLSPWLLRFQLDDNKIMERRLNIEEIRDKIHGFYPKLVNIMHSDINFVQSSAPGEDGIVMRIRMKKFDKDNEDELQVLKSLEIELLKSMSLKGFPEISKVYAKQIEYPYYDEETGASAKTRKEHWMLETDGVALAKVMNENYVDFKRTSSNDILEIFTVLGIEAVRHSILNELRQVLGAYSIYVNYRHISTLCDVMTQRGMLTAITRHGINRIETGALRRCSFEETVEILLEAAAYAEVDHLRGVSENIIMGQLAPLGTGCFELMLDKKVLKEHANDRGLGEESHEMDTPIHPYKEEFTPLPEMTPGPNSIEGSTQPGNMSTWEHQDAIMTPVPGQGGPDYGGINSPDSYINTPSYNGATSPIYVPKTPICNPGSSYTQNDGTGSHSSPGYSPTNPYTSTYSPVAPHSPMAAQSPSYGGGGMANAGQSPLYSPNIHRAYNHTSPQYSPTANNSYASPSYSLGMSSGLNNLSNAHMHQRKFKNEGDYYNGDAGSGGGGANPTSPVYNPTTPAYGGAYSAYSPAPYSAKDEDVEPKEESKEDHSENGFKANGHDDEMKGAPAHYVPYNPDKEASN